MNETTKKETRRKDLLLAVTALDMAGETLTKRLGINSVVAPQEETEEKKVEKVAVKKKTKKILKTFRYIGKQMTRQI